MSFQSSNYLSLLFNEGVYIIEEQEKERKIDVLSQSKAAPTFEYIGNNKKNILIITHHNKSSLSGGEKEFLIKILSALKLSIEDVAIVNSDNLDFDQLKMYFNPSHILAFTGPKKIDSLNGDKYVFSKFGNVFQLQADELPLIENDKAKKALLWNSIKDVLTGI